MLIFKFDHPLVNGALAAAVEWHGTQVRKYTGAPYWTHPREVALILARCGIEDPEILAAAMLHDVLEDCPQITVDMIKDCFGARVAALVVDLTEVETEGNRAIRKAREAIRLGSIHSDAMTVKCADLISNTSDIVKHDEKFARTYLQEKRDVLYHLSGGADPVVYAWAFRSLGAAQDALAAT